MDVDDDFRAPPGYRRMACACAVEPSPPVVVCGCRCPVCGATCRECPGFGYVLPPEKRFYEILSRVRSVIRRRIRRRGFPPGFVRIAESEVRVLARKRRAEDASHWIHTYVDLGPPMRVFDVIVVVDRRKG